MARRRYSDDERANALAALDANGGDESKTSKQLKIPRATLQDWSKGRVADSVPELRQLKKPELADKLEEIARKLVDAMPDKISEASLQQIATSAAIAIDKMRLLREQPTSNAGNANLTDAERVARLAALADAARARRNGHAHPTAAMVASAN